MNKFLILSFLLFSTAQASAENVGQFRQLLDHTASRPGQTFNQRYWIDSQYASGPNAPVLFRVCGEDLPEKHCRNEGTAPFAKELKAHIVRLEHRYYGTSLPFSDLSPEHLQYLTLNNAIEDLAYFQRWIVATKGLYGKWIALGGSYSGTLAALYRMRHPELVVGALAASAVMHSPYLTPGGKVDWISSIDPNAYSSDYTWIRPWTYQSCTSFSFWLHYDGSAKEPSPELCAFLGVRTPIPHEEFDQAFFYPIIESNSSVSNILFTTGANDEWLMFGITPQNNRNPHIHALIIADAGHHIDLNAPSSTDQASVIEARQLFLQLARQWLQ